jgi:hypothetical protein
MKRLLALCVLAVLGCAVTGCHTVQKTGTGAADGATVGAKQDWNDACQGIKDADGWVKKNLW